jgi:hypothetical protein
MEMDKTNPTPRTLRQGFEMARQGYTRQAIF